MIPDVIYWAELFGLLALETAACAIAAGLLIGRCRTPRGRLAVAQAGMVAAGLLSLGELVGARRWLDASQPIVIPATGTVVLFAPWELSSVGDSLSQADPAVKARAPLSANAVWWPGILWVAGTVVLVTRAVALRGCLAWWRRRSRPADPETLECVERLSRRMGLGPVEVRLWPRPLGPFACGVVRPRIALPVDFRARFTCPQREAMLAHELAHLAGRDPFWAGVSEGICALLWWQPLVWWLRGRIRAESETAADAAAAVIPGGREALAESLMAIGRELVGARGPRVLAVKGSGLKSGLGRRVSALLGPAPEGDPVPRDRRGLWMLVAGASVLLILGLPVPGSPVVPLLDLQAHAGNAGMSRHRNGDERGRDGAHVINLSQVDAAAADRNRASEEVTIHVKLIEVPERDPDELGFDWIFGPVTSNDSSMSVETPSGDLPLSDSPDAANVRVDRRRIEGQAAILNERQVRALMRHLQGIPGIRFIAPPAVASRSGETVRVQTTDLRTIVTGATTNVHNGPHGPSIEYRTETTPFGPTVDVSLVREDDHWRIGVSGRLSEFLGYNEPGPDQKVEVRDAAGKVLKGQFPLPVLRVREASGSGRIASGETLALRGPVAENRVRIRGGWFRRDRIEIERRRLYLLITPVPGGAG